MKIQIKHLLYFIAITIVAMGCQKEDELYKATTDLISIDSLVANFNTVMAWDTTTITCHARGDSLTYSWECDHGSFNGSGTQIRYAAGQCCIGINTITCEISNHHGKASESIEIEVTTYIKP